MSVSDLRASVEASSPNEQMILALLALAGEPCGKARVLEHMEQAGIAMKAEDVSEAAISLRARGLVQDLAGRGLVIVQEASWPAIRAAIDAKRLYALCTSYELVTPLRKNWEGWVVLRSYRQGVALLRMALVRGEGPATVAPLLAACMNCHEAGYLHPLVDICARPFEPEMFARIHPMLRDEVLTVLVDNAQREPASAPVLRAYAERYVAQGSASMALRIALAEHLILCGRLDDATRMLQDLDDSLALFFRSMLSCW